MAGIVGGAFKVAIVEQEAETYIVRVGERIGTATVVAISADEVVLRQDSSVFTLVLAQASGVTSLAATTLPNAPAPGSGGTGGPQTPPAGTGQPPQPAPGATTGAPPAPATAQPTSAPAPSGSTPPPSSSTTANPGAGQGAPVDQTPSPAPAFPSVVGSNTGQPPIPPVMPAGSTVYTPQVFTPQPKGGTGDPRAP